MTPTDYPRLFWPALVCTAWTFSAGACSYGDSSRNALYQQTGEERSNMPKKHPPWKYEPVRRVARWAVGP